MLTWLIVLVICLPWLGAIAVLAAGDGRPRAQNALAVAFAATSGAAALLMLPFARAGDALTIHVGGMLGDVSFTADGLGVVLAAIATVIGSLAVIFSVDYMRGEMQLGRYYFLVLFFIGGMTGLVLTSSLLMLFFFWEIVAFCSYALISFHNDDPKAVAGGIKALIITQVGGIGLLAGALGAFAMTGAYSISTFTAQAHNLPPVALALIAYGFLVAAAAKSAQFPFQTWLPDAMEAPTPVSALIHAATMVNAGVYILARFYPAFSGVPGWSTSVAIVGLVSVLLAAFMACVATDLKRVLAYSTVSQLGYMFAAIGAGALYAGEFHLLSHAVFKGLLFLGAGAVIHALGTRDMRQMGGLRGVLPFVSAVFVIGALALAGIPVTNGFWSKELILEESLLSGQAWLYAGLLLGAGLTAFYSFRMVSLTFGGSPCHSRQVHDAPAAMRFSLSVLALGTLTTWLIAGPYEHLIWPEAEVGQTALESTLAIVEQVLSAPATLVALVVIALGLGAWHYRERIDWLQRALRPVRELAEWSFGFESVNGAIVSVVRKASGALGLTQTGQLNWNLAGIVGALAVLLLFLAARG